MLAHGKGGAGTVLSHFVLGAGSRDPCQPGLALLISPDEVQGPVLLSAAAGEEQG